MESLASLIAHLKNSGVLYNPELIRAFEKIDRKYFVPEKLQNLVYLDEALPIGEGQTISQPFTVAFMLELLSPRQGNRVLDVGSGSGYTTALLAEIVGTRGQVVGVEIVPELVDMGKKNLAKYHFSNAEIRKTNGTLGIPEEAPYDRILVSASATKIPKPLLNQLKVGGRMVLSINNKICKIEKKGVHDIEIEKHPGFIFVPLIEKL